MSKYDARSSKGIFHRKILRKTPLFDGCSILVRISFFFNYQHKSFSSCYDTIRRFRSIIVNFCHEWTFFERLLSNSNVDDYGNKYSPHETKLFWNTLNRNSHQRWSKKKMFQKWFQYSQKNTCRPATLLKGDSNTGASQWILRNFEEHVFWRASTSEHFCLNMCWYLCFYIWIFSHYYIRLSHFTVFILSRVWYCELRNKGSLQNF